MPADLRRPDADSGESDDWLGDEAALDWDEEATASSPAVAPHATPHAAPADAATLRRRRLFALLALLALIGAGVGIAIAVAGGGGSTAQETLFTATTEPTATQPPATTPPATTAPKTTPAAPTVKLPASGKLQRGDSGDEVKQLQRALTTLGYEAGTADGSFGPTTEKAVADFQRAQGLFADGVVGAETVRELNQALAGRGGV